MAHDTDMRRRRSERMHCMKQNRLNTTLSSHRVDVVVSLCEWLVVLYNGSQLWKSVSDFEYLLKLFVRVDNDDVTLGTVGDAPARVRRVCTVYSGCQTAVHSIIDSI